MLAVSIDPNMKVKSAERGLVPVQSASCSSSLLVPRRAPGRLVGFCAPATSAKRDADEHARCLVLAVVFCLKVRPLFLALRAGRRRGGSMLRTKRVSLTRCTRPQEKKSASSRRPPSSGSQLTPPPSPSLLSRARSAKKINSHRWFFNAFGPILSPNICMLIDVGTQPRDTSLYKLWKSFDVRAPRSPPSPPAPSSIQSGRIDR